jgi:hypothetical protein
LEEFEKRNRIIKIGKFFELCEKIDKCKDFGGICKKRLIQGL